MNTFIKRKAMTKPLSARQARRRSRLTGRQQSRVLDRLAKIAGKKQRRSLIEEAVRRHVSE